MARPRVTATRILTVRLGTVRTCTRRPRNATRVDGLIAGFRPAAPTISIRTEAVAPDALLASMRTNRPEGTLRGAV